MAKDDDGKIAVNFRFDEALHRQLADAAKDSVRSLNGEILYRLRKSFEQRSGEQAAA